MTLQTLLVFIILGATIFLFIADRIRLDIVALLSLVTLLLTGILTPPEALAGFSDPLVLTRPIFCSEPAFAAADVRPRE